MFEGTMPNTLNYPDGPDGQQRASDGSFYRGFEFSLGDLYKPEGGGLYEYFQGVKDQLVEGGCDASCVDDVLSASGFG